MSQNQIQIELTPIHRVLSLALFIAQFVPSIIFYIMFTHYYTIALPFLPTVSMVTAKTTKTHYGWNLLLLLGFWVQHIIMATIKYKLVGFSIWKYFALYERYIFNLASGIYLMFMFIYLRPSYHYLFSIPDYLCLPFSILGVLIFIKSQLELGSLIFMPFSIKSIINDKFITINSYDSKNLKGVKADGLYKWHRHPMQTGLLLMIIFGNGVYTVDRLIFAVTMAVFVVIGVLLEESRMSASFIEYQAYKKKVTARFIPFFI